MLFMAKPPLAAAALAVALVAVITACASAYTSLSIERGGTIRQTSSGKITFQAGLVSVACNLTLAGELSTGPFREELPIPAGRVARLEWNECTGGEIIEILGLPWQIRIERLLEAASEARIAGIRPEALTGGLVTLRESGGGRAVGWELLIGGLKCLFGGRGEAPSALLPLTRTGTREGRYLYSLGALTLLEEVRFLKSAGSELCPPSGVIRGRLNPAEPAQTAIFQ